MPKRYGQLFDKTFTLEALYTAYYRARRGKRKTLAVMRFEADLGSNLQALHDELHCGTYTPQPYRHFVISEPKPRQISAPAFRDVVVQHAIYGLLNPIFDRLFIHDSYGCRVAKGTHRASDAAQRYLRQSAEDSYTLQLDVRRFYYSIDRTILRGLVERKIKDRRFVDLMMVFADHGEPVGIPIGNLLSQLYALIYLDPLDHFIKREMKISRYVRYVDDFILFDLSRDDAGTCRLVIADFLRERLNLTLSRWTIAAVKRGVNFVGFRTWRKRRFVRKHSLFRFSRSLRCGDVQSLNSILGNASRTASHAHMCKRLRGERPDLFPELREAGSSFRGAVLAAKPVFDPKPSAVRESSGATRFAANSYEAPGFIESSELVPVLHGFSGSNVERNRNTLAYTGSCEGNRVFDNKPQVGRRRLDFV